MYQILLCDDEKDIVTALEIYLRNDDYKIFRHVLNHSFAAICSLAAAKRKAMFILLAVSY